MEKEKYIRKFCKLKNKEVRLSEERIYELGREDIVGKDQKCLDRDESCKELGCEYAPRGIGDVGGKNPF